MTGHTEVKDTAQGTSNKSPESKRDNNSLVKLERKKPRGPQTWKHKTNVGGPKKVSVQVSS